MITSKNAMSMTIAAVLLAAASDIYALETNYDGNAPLHITKVVFCEKKPKGLGKLEEKTGITFEKGVPDVYLYAELSNCRNFKDANNFWIKLTMDMDIYYENGACIYSGKEVNAFEYRSTARASQAYIWARIESRYLKPGQYKIEMTVRDENSGKEAFTVKTFNVI